jgi:predicted kinase
VRSRPANLARIAPDALPYTIFLLSPANLSGERGALVFRPQAQFALARGLRAPGGTPLGPVFSFISGLYFRGKMTYAERFGRPPPGLSSGGLVISPSEGLRFLQEPVTLERLQAWAKVDIDAANPGFTRPLIEHAVALERAHGGDTRFVLLGSVASDKYVAPLTRVFGDHLLFPPDFIGRGDMSRGALLLRCARAGRELDYAPIEGSLRHGPRAPGIAGHAIAQLLGPRPVPTPPALAPRTRTARKRTPALPLPPPTPVARARGRPPELVVLVGLPGAGKSTFFRQRFAETHTHVSKDLLRNNAQPTRRQEILIAEALAAGRDVVVDNTNASRAERASLLALARAAGARAIAYLFDCHPRDCLARNNERTGRARVPPVAIYATARRLTPPTVDEGFAEVHTVQPRPGPTFELTPDTARP